jgi:5-(carboxyamino)imidazole ribonucleotide synthase
VLGGARVALASALAEVDDAGAKIQLYGKGVRAGRKVGHVNVSAGTREEAYARAVAAAAIVRDGGGA